MFEVFGGISEGCLGSGDTEHTEVTVEISVDETIPDESTFCPACSAYSNAISFVAGAINSRTGGLYYPVEDLSFSTSAGPLTFNRDYVSLATNTYTAPLGYGWTSNQDIRLIFPTDPQGKAGFVLFKDGSGNLYRFYDLGDNTYLPYAGVTSSLIRNNPTKFTLTDQDQNIYTFDADGKILTLVNKNHKSFTYSYNTDGLLASVSADSGTRYLNFQYNNLNQLITVSDHTGRHVSYDYTGDGDLASVTDAPGHLWSYTYDGSHHLLKVIDPNGVVEKSNQYDAQGRTIQQSNGEGKPIAALTYNSDGSTTIEDALGNTQIDQYDSLGTLTNQTNSLGTVTSRSYDGSYRPTAMTDLEGKVTNMSWSGDGANLTEVITSMSLDTIIAYDAFNNPTSTTESHHLTTYTYSTDGELLTGVEDALKGQTTYTYTADNQLASQTDPLGHITTYTYDAHGQRSSMTDPFGHYWHYGYDDLGRLVDTTDPLGRITHNEYDLSGRLVRSTRNYDPNRPKNDQALYNIVTEYAYDTSGNQIAVTDTYGHSTQYEYDHAGHLLKTTDQAGHFTTNTYDDDGHLLTSTDPMGRTTQYIYDAGGRQIHAIDAKGNLTSTSYNPDGTVASTTDGLGNTTTYTYSDDGLGKKDVKTTDPLGVLSATRYDNMGNPYIVYHPDTSTTHYTYDALNRLIYSYPYPSTLGPGTHYYYDAAGRQVQVVDPLGHATTNGYDEDGQLTSITDARGNITHYEYDAAGRKTAEVDAAGYRTTYTYDLLDRLVATSDPLGHTTTNSYDALGNLLSSKDATGNITTNEYDSLNRLTSQTDPKGGITSYTYDAVGNRLSVTDPAGHTTTTVYDELNRPISVTDAANHSTSTDYDAAGNILKTTDAAGQATTYTYDADNEKLSVTDAMGNVTSYQYQASTDYTATITTNGTNTRTQSSTYDWKNRVRDVSGGGFYDDTYYYYDADGNLTKIWMIRGRGYTLYTYDELNRKLSETDQLGNKWLYGYDTVGNRTSVLDANGNTINYVYDADHQLTKIDYPGSTADVTFTYDAAGRRTVMNDGLGTTSWTYDALNRPIAISDPFNKTIDYTYDLVGNRASLSYADGKTVNYTYDPVNQLSAVEDWNHHVTNYAYTPSGQLASAALPNGVGLSYTYNNAGQLTQLQHNLGLAELSSFKYTYDGFGDRTQAQEHIVPPSQSISQNMLQLMAPSSGTAFGNSTNTSMAALPPSSIDSAPIQPAGAVQGKSRLALIASSLYGKLFAVKPVPLAAASTSTSTPTKTVPTSTRTNTATKTVPTATRTSTATKTVPTSTRTFTATKTVPTSTRTLTATNTVPTSTRTSTATNTVPTSTRTSTATNTRTFTPTASRTFTPTLSSTYTATKTATSTATNTIPTSTWTYTFTNTRTFTSTASRTFTPTSSSTYTSTNTATSTATNTVPTSTRTSTFTRTFTSTASRAFTPTPSSTYTSTNTATSTPTATDTDISTSTPTSTDTYTPTPTITPTRIPTLIIDNFDGTFLSPDWEWYLPYSGPTYQMGVKPGNLHLVVPTFRDPEFRRSDMGSGDWAIETHVSLGDNSVTEPFTFNLMVGYGQTDQLLLSADSDGTLKVVRVGEDPVAFAYDSNLPLYLRIQKNGSQYTFYYKQDSGDPETDALTPWIILGTYSLDLPVTYVGCKVNTYNTSADAIFDVDYFRLERYGPAAPAPYTEVVVDDFTGSLSPAWEWYVPKAGPTYSLDNGFSISLPPWQSFERDSDVDEAPQLRRTDLGDGDWAIETQLTTINAEDAAYWAALEVGFDQYTQIMAGMDSAGQVIFKLPSNGWPDYYEYPPLPIYLRLEKHGEEYTLKYRNDPNEAWTMTAPRDYPGTPQNVGLIARVPFTGGATPLEIHWSSFRLERWPNNPSTPTPTPTETLTPTSTDMYTPTETYTPTASDTPTPMDTPIDTDTPTVTDTSTVTLTPTISDTPTLTLTPTASNTSTPTDTPTSTPTRTPTPTQVFPAGPVTIAYSYDIYDELIAADYSNGQFYHYTYDMMGDRLTERTLLTGTKTYTYDADNRIASVNGVAYTWDNNGNLLNDGTNTYTYDAANQLISVVGPAGTSTYRYDGLGNRYQESLNGQTTTYTLDLAGGLTQVLDNGTYKYIYGVGRIAQSNAADTEYFLGDALGSVCQLTDASGAITLAESYDPFGNVTSSSGSTTTPYGYTGEQTDSYIKLINLRSRLYSPSTGTFLTRDSWQGDYNRPATLNRWNYVEGNPVNFTDPSGKCTGDNCANLTYWLISAMNSNSQSPEVNQLAQLNSLGNLSIAATIAKYLEQHIGDQQKNILGDCDLISLIWDFSSNLPGFNKGGSPKDLFKKQAFIEWINLVKKGARWDFKVPIANKLSQSIRMCSEQNGCNWFSWDDIANIHFGYIGIAAGFTSLELHAGAGMAQLIDDPKDARWYVGFDEPGDFWAVEMGISLYNKSRSGHLDYDSFSIVLNDFYPFLKHGTRPDITVYPFNFEMDEQLGPKFPVDYFNGD